MHPVLIYKASFLDENTGSCSGRAFLLCVVERGEKSAVLPCLTFCLN